MSEEERAHQGLHTLKSICALTLPPTPSPGQPLLNAGLLSILWGTAGLGPAAPVLRVNGPCGLDVSPLPIAVPWGF